MSNRRDEIWENFKDRDTSELRGTLEHEKEARAAGESAGLGDTPEEQREIEEAQDDLISVLGFIIASRD